MPRSPKSLKDQVFGRLTVLRQISRNAHGNSRWLCLCECGAETEVYYQNLTRGRVKSCGCQGKK